MANDTDRQAEILAEYAEMRAAEARDEFVNNVSDWVEPSATPIERLMAIGLIFAIQSEAWFGFPPQNNEFYLAESEGDAFVVPVFGPSIYIWQQVKVDKYKADFVVRFAHWRGGAVFGAIECDGHNHHDLTKEQAIHDRERDRHFQARGIIILRYTGKEIYRNPLKCAADALGILERRAEDPSAPRWKEGT